MASASTVAVVVPSPATSLVLEATSLTSCTPMFSYLSSSSMSWATVTPSFVTLGEPHPLSSTAFRPRGPRVLLTARASLETPSSRLLRTSSSKLISLATIPPQPAIACDVDGPDPPAWRPGSQSRYSDWDDQDRILPFDRFSTSSNQVGGSESRFRADGGYGVKTLENHVIPLWFT